MKELIISFSLLLLLSACTAESKRNEPTVKEEINEETATVDEFKKASYYAIPSPEEMFAFINDNGIAYNKSLLHDYREASNYTDPSKKALVFGIYAADLAYTAAYQDVESTIKLYETVRKLSLDLQIEELMTEDMVAQIQANMENPDSLALIASDAYYNAVQYLEGNGQKGKLALMSLGGWTESIYISLNAIEDVDLASSAVERIAAQKITYDNLYTYLSKNRNELGVTNELKKIQEIKGVFDSFQQGPSVKSMKKKEGKLVFGKGKKTQMTMDQFLKLREEVGMYRSQIVAQNI
ncbi:hypothetical protein N9515_01695 [Vicingaceae bacterium]|nr:hypothetical protein [Vicingaceae bacterium]MDB4060655.1 hypothetical protein [Vicingaceae bacterium]